MLESFKELFSSTVSTAAQRVRNPAIGAFVLSWCAFNWKSILYLLLSDTKVIDKIAYISENSTWKTVIGYPCVSVIVICGILPWANNLISVWQAKPLDNSDSIENRRKAKLIHRATRLQRLQAKHDVTYEKIKTGAEKDIQAMKEHIAESKDRMGILTAELNEKDNLLHEYKLKIDQLSSTLETTRNDLGRVSKSYSLLKNEYDSLKIECDGYKNTIRTTVSPPLSGGFNELKGLQIGEIATNVLNGQAYKNTFIFDKENNDNPNFAPSPKNPKL
ncbi:hypothetical protein [Citrobacter sp. Ce129]|uniref:hypothetical protein n=1 Tax=Citrobacter sp. Ce129 TaxID=2985043 RepID=UPI00257745D1|nr:hypothetical protein [Citrobacter sp. Ce129]MDM3271617.1 hypothetical protein [Citrobacter sp. Ce129]